ncbi:thioredoxin domain-containing protein [Parablastomonas sp. CN1-191]|uniref:thioredoxin domain-containing protein n=1 Tax=Parablastomonas sp. CN1-191 TaxID=3400908 RepID=UPI003BF887A3
MKPIRFAALALVAAFSLAAGPAANWNTVVARTPTGANILGNPAAKVLLTEYASYTCPHCADFEREAGGALRLAYVYPGKMRWEIRNYVRDPVDLAWAMAANCGPKEKFFLNNAAIFGSQKVWSKPMTTATEAQSVRWRNPDLAQRNRAIAADFKIFEIMATRGYDRQTMDRCLTDKALEARLAAQTDAADAAGIDSTPSFAIDEEVLVGTHSWDLLAPQLAARF